MNITASEQNRLLNLSQINDGITTPTYKWFTLQDNLLDDTYHLVDTAQQVGWWGTSLSDASGNLTSNPTLTITLDSATFVHAFRVTGDSLLNEYPVDFQIQLYDDIGTLLHTESVTGNTSVDRMVYMDTVYQPIVIKLVVTKVNGANQTVKILETWYTNELHRIDTLTPKITETVNTIVSDTSTDTLTSNISDATVSIKVTETSTDSILVKANDITIAAGNSAESADILTPNVSDVTVGIHATIISTDILTPKVVDLGIYRSFPSTDILTPNVTDNEVNTIVTDTSTDILTPNVTDVTVDIHVSDSSVDTLTPNITDSTILVKNNDTSIDALTPNLTESTTVFTVTLNSTDILTPNVGDITLAMNVSDSSSDTILVKAGDMSTYKFFISTDVLLTKLAEVDNQTVNILAGDQLQLWDVFEDLIHGVSDNYNHKLHQVYDQVIDTPRGFYLYSNILDGSCQLIDDATQQGWITSQVADGSGNLTDVYASVAVPLRDITQLGLYGYYGNYPVDFLIDIYNKYGLLDSINVIGNTSERYTLNVNYAEVAQIQYTITKVSKPNAPVHLIEILPNNRTTIVGVSFATTDEVLIALDEPVDITVSFDSVDTITPMIVEADNITANVSDTDILTPNLSEFIPTKTFGAGDILLPNTAEQTKAGEVTLGASDSLLPHIDESDSLSNSFGSTDTLTPHIDDLHKYKAFASVDTILPTLAETVAVTNQLVAADAILATLVEVIGITNQIVSSDLITPKIVDLLVYKSFGAADTLLPKITETVSVRNTFSTADTILTTITDVTNYVGTKLTTTDTLLTKIVEGGVQVLNSLIDTDVLSTKLFEEIFMTNVHTRMDDDVRRVYGKVEITYTDPLFDSSLSATASNEQWFAPADAVVDGATQIEYKSFSLHDNILNGSYHLIDPETLGSWWGTQLSDVNGAFSTPPTINITFTPRPFYTLLVKGDDKLNCFPVAFTLTLYDSNNLIRHQEVVVNNTLCAWTKDIGEVTNVARMTISIGQINQPLSVAKLAELYSVIVKEYTAEEVVSIGLLEELNYVSNDIPIGAVSSNELDVSIDNTSRIFSKGNKTSPLVNLMKKNRCVKAWLGVEVVLGTIEWHPLGTFYTVDWKTPNNAAVVNITARDRLDLLNNDHFKSTQIYTNNTLYQLFETVLQAYGLEAAEYSIDTGLQSITIPYAWFDKVTYREALAKLATCALVNVYCNRNNVIVVDLMTNNNGGVIYTFDDDKNIYDRDYPLAWADIINSVEIYTYKVMPQSSKVIYSSAEVISFIAFEEQTITCLYDSNPCYNVQAPSFSGGANMSLTGYTAYTWGMELTFKNNSALPQQVTDISISGQYLDVQQSRSAVVEDAASIKSDGKSISAPVDCQFIQNFGYARTFGQNILQRYLNTNNYAALDSRGNIALGINDKVAVVNPFDATTDEYIVCRQSIDWSGALKATVEVR